jgi:hypothetical protein
MYLLVKNLSIFLASYPRGIRAAEKNKQNGGTP